MWITQAFDPASRSQRVLRIASVTLFAAAALGATVASAVALHWFGIPISPLPVVAMAVAMAFAAGAAALQVSRRSRPAAACAVAAAIVLYPLLAASLAPALEPVWMSRTIAAHVSDDRVPTDPPVILAGYLEPSLVFLLGTQTNLEGGGSAGALAAKQGGLAIVGDRERTRFLGALHGAGAKERDVDQVSGFDYSRGKNEHVTIYRVTPASPPR